MGGKPAEPLRQINALVESTKEIFDALGEVNGNQAVIHFENDSAKK